MTVDFFTKELKLKSLALIHDQSIYGEGLATAVKTKFEEAGGSVTAFEGVDSRRIRLLGGGYRCDRRQSPGVYFGGMDAEGINWRCSYVRPDWTGVFFGPDGI